MKDDEKILCEFKHCSRCENGKCIALTDTDFGDRKCPFFGDRFKAKKIKEFKTMIEANNKIIKQLRDEIALLDTRNNKIRKQIEEL